MHPLVSAWIRLAIIGFTHGEIINTGHGTQLRSMTVPVPHSAAESFCSALPVSSHLVDDSIDHEELGIYMRNNSLSTVWLGIKRKGLPTWQWVDGNEWTLKMSDGSIAAGACAGVSTVTRTLRALGCDYGGDYEGMVCEHEGSCNHNVSLDPSFCLNGKIYSFRCGITNWYAARDLCDNDKKVLAKLDTKEKINAFHEAKSKLASMSLCGFFWIGLRKEDWYRTQADGGDIISISRWDRGEPKDSLQCAAASLRQNEMVWTVEDCKEKHAAVCMQSAVKHTDVIKGTSKYRMTTEISENMTAFSTKTAEYVSGNEDDPKLNIVAVTGSFLAIVIVIGFAILCYRKRRKIIKCTRADSIESGYVDIQHQYGSVPLEEPLTTASPSEQTESIEKIDAKVPIEHHMVLIEGTVNIERSFNAETGATGQSVIHEENIQTIPDVQYSTSQRRIEEKCALEERKALEIVPLLKPHNKEIWDIFSKNTVGAAPTFRITILCENETSVHMGKMLGDKDNNMKRGFRERFLDVFRIVLGVDKTLHLIKGSLEKIHAATISYKSSDPYNKEMEGRLLGRNSDIIVDMTRKSNQQANPWYEKKKEKSVIIKHDESKNGDLCQNMLIPRHYFRLGSAYEDKDMGFASDVSTWTVVVICTLILWSSKASSAHTHAVQNTDNMRRILDHMRTLSRGSIHPHILWEHLLDWNKMVEILQTQEQDA